MRKILFCQFLLMAVGLATFPVKSSYAGSATWRVSPGNSEWSNAANWSPMTVPNGASDVATFGTSNGTAIALPALNEVNSIVFSPGASSFSFTEYGGTFTISGTGVINDSGLPQNFVLYPPQQQFGADAVISFSGQASAGTATYSIYGTAFEAIPQGKAYFYDNATAANATFFNHTGVFGVGGHTSFFDASNAGNATIFNDGASATGGFASGFTEFYGTSSADHASFTCSGADVLFGGAFGGSVSFYDDTTAAESTFVVEGGTVAQAPGGQVSFSANATADNATLTIGAGSNGGLDGHLYFAFDSLGGQSRIILSGTLDLTGHKRPGITIGSIEGSGRVILGGNRLSAGSSQLSTTFSGKIEDGNTAGGSLRIIGGSLALTNDNSYTGGTTINGGTLVVDNPAGSATGSGAVEVNGGTLSGGGTIAGSVAVGAGSGRRATLAPAVGGKQKNLIIQGALTLEAHGTYKYSFKAKGNQARADQVTANGVTLNSGATFRLSGQANGTLAPGLEIVLMSNTSAAPINGTFSNLADGATVVVGSNILEASYEGGDGNDLTLTVVQ